MQDSRLEGSPVQQVDEFGGLPSSASMNSPSHQLPSGLDPEVVDVDGVQVSATPPHEEGDSIVVDKKTCSVGDTILVTWEINTRPFHQQDFIGMFEVAGDGEVGGRGQESHVTAQGLLDSRVRGSTSAYGGCLQWELTEDIFPKRKPSCCLVSFIQLREVQSR